MGYAYDCEHGSMSAEALLYTTGYWQHKALEYAQRLAEERAEIIQNLEREIERLRETKDYALLTQLRDENRLLRETLDIATHGIEETVSRLKAHRD